MTFSIVGKEGESFGVGVASGSTGVRDRVPWARKGVGAIATQGYTEIRYGSQGLKHLKEDENPQETLSKLTEKDPEPEKRQVAVIDCDGKKAVHTGSACPRTINSELGTDFIVIGNMLENKRTVSSMTRSFKDSDEKLPIRIIEALKEGAKAGGDRRGNRTAALLVRGSNEVDIGIKSHETPVKELERVYRLRS